MPKTKKYILLDSAGIRKHSKRQMGAEDFAVFRTIQAAKECNVICLVVDGSQPLTHQDQVVASIAKESNKGIVVIANKSDIVDDYLKKEFERSFYLKFAFLKVLNFIWISALKKHGLHEVWKAVDIAIMQQSIEIDPIHLRKIFNFLIKKKPPTKLSTQKKPILYDLIFSKSSPPTFDLLIKDKKTLDKGYIKFLENFLRKEFNLTSTGFKINLIEIKKKRLI